MFLNSLNLIIYLFEEWGKKKFNFLKFWILELCCFKKSQFFKSIISEHFFTKISGNGSWVSRRYCIFTLKWPFVGQPDNLIGWATSLAYTWDSSTYIRTIYWNFGEKMFRNDGFEKLTFFETTQFQYSKF